MADNCKSEQLQLSLGLINSGKKYLTVEKFANKINANGTSLKQKQTWSLEQNSEGSDVYFKSCYGRYLGTDKNGEVTCNAEVPGPDNAFQVEATISDARWAIKSKEHGGYLGSQSGELSSKYREVSPTVIWTVHLAMHPQVNLYHGRRKAYASLENDEVHIKKLIPWGVSTLVTLDFQMGSYALLLANSKYLADNGSLSDEVSKNTLYNIEFYSGKIAFKSAGSKKYLTSVGPFGKLQTRKDKPGVDEHFTFVDAHPQIALKSKKKEKYVSGKQGLQLSANQNEVEESEIFQLEMQKGTNKVFFRNNKEKYWRLDGNSVKADATSNTTLGTEFEIEWNGRTVQIKANDGRPLGVVLSGHLQVGTADDFFWELRNRPLIVFRGEHGFIGMKGEKIEGNKSKYDIFQLEYMDGAYAVKCPKGQYWNVDDDKKLVAGSQKQPFLIQICQSSKLCIKPENGGDYITSDHVGIMSASEANICTKSLWEY